MFSYVSTWPVGLPGFYDANCLHVVFVFCLGDRTLKLVTRKRPFVVFVQIIIHLKFALF